MKKILKNKKAITLIALVITIVVLIIIAGIVINMTLGENGILNKTKQAKQDYQIAQNEEREFADSVANQIDNETAVGSRDEVTVSKKEFDELKQTVTDLQNQLNSRCNPKRLTTISLPSTQSGVRAVGTYNAESSSWTKTNTTDFDDYLSFTENVGWTIKKSGEYFITDSTSSNYKTSWSDVGNVMRVNNQDYTLTYIAVRPSNEYKYDVNTTTMYLKKDTVIKFYNYITNANAMWHHATITISAMFETV